MMVPRAMSAVGWIFSSEPNADHASIEVDLDPPCGHDEVFDLGIENGQPVLHCRACRTNHSVRIAFIK